jgi:hypothetical protein
MGRSAKAVADVVQQNSPGSQSMPVLDQINASTHAHEFFHLLLLHSRLKLSLLGGRKSIGTVSTFDESIRFKSHEPVHLESV